VSKEVCVEFTLLRDELLALAAQLSPVTAVVSMPTYHSQLPEVTLTRYLGALKQC
jgi:hypothetical protein